MTPQEKAKEIFDRMYQVSDELNKYPMCFDNAKQCALIAVDEILKTLVDLSNGEFTFIYQVQYWQEVKQEIEKI